MRPLAGLCLLPLFSAGCDKLLGIPDPALDDGLGEGQQEVAFRASWAAEPSCGDIEFIEIVLDDGLRDHVHSFACTDGEGQTDGHPLGEHSLFWTFRDTDNELIDTAFIETVTVEVPQVYDLGHFTFEFPRP